MANLVYVGRRGFIKDTEQSSTHVWVGRRGFYQEGAAPAGGAESKLVVLKRRRGH